MTRPRLRRRLCAAIVCLGLLPAPTVSAAPPASTKQRRRTKKAKPPQPDPELLAAIAALADEANARFDTRDFEGALRKWNEAYERLPDAPIYADHRRHLLIQMAWTYVGAYDYTEDVAYLVYARQVFVRYLDSLPEDDVENRRIIGEQLADIDAKLEAHARADDFRELANYDAYRSDYVHRYGPARIGVGPRPRRADTHRLGVGLESIGRDDLALRYRGSQAMTWIGSFLFVAGLPAGLSVTASSAAIAAATRVDNPIDDPFGELGPIDVPGVASGGTGGVGNATLALGLTSLGIGLAGLGMVVGARLWHARGQYIDDALREHNRRIMAEHGLVEGPPRARDVVAPRNTLRWASVAGTSIGGAMTIVGGALVGINNTCPGGQDPMTEFDDCPKVYDTVIPGGVMLGLGATSFVASGILLLVTEVPRARAKQRRLSAPRPSALERGLHRAQQRTGIRLSLGAPGLRLGAP